MAQISEPIPLDSQNSREFKEREPVSTRQSHDPVVDIDHAGTLLNRHTVYEHLPKNLEHKEVPLQHVVRLAPLVDHSQTTPTTTRVAVRRLVEDGAIKIGRLERTNEKTKPIVYPSKVVSRVHAELILQEGDWYLRDVGSSSGTFLNNERLSLPSTESGLRRITTGDVIRFGVDFRGGQEPQFRSIRVRVELDGGAGKEPREFHRSQFAKLRGISDAGNDAELETCAFCLEEMLPFNSLFVAPCCHIWHYKCIRSTVVNNYPYFECPMCRKTFDLEDASDDDNDDTEL